MSETSMKNETRDVAGVVELDSAELQIDAGPIQANFAEGETGGIRVLQNEGWMCINLGVDYPDGGRATIGQSMEPDQARALGRILFEAADETERQRQENRERHESTRTWRDGFRELIGRE